MRIVIYKSRLRLDVATETRKAGMMQIAGDKQEERLESQLGEEFSDEAYFSRRCQQGITALSDLLHKFITKIQYKYIEYDDSFDDSDDEVEDIQRGPDGHNALENTTKAVQRWVLILRVDARRSAMPYALSDLCHQFIAAHMLYEWAVMALPASASEYKEQREVARLEIQRYVYRKELPEVQQQ
jgi:hypothetical protein